MLEVRVGAERRPAAVHVAGSPGDRADVDTSGNQVGDHEVAKVVQPTAHPETLGELGEPMGDAIGPDWLGAVGLMAEDVGVGRERHAGGKGDLGLLDPMGAQQIPVIGMPCTQSVWCTRSLPVKARRNTSPGRIGGWPLRMRR
jgi:hypothetical protein